jgi:hypothetical protein
MNRRADRIRAFREELAALQAEGIEAMPPDRAERVRAHHDAILASVAARVDGDASDAEARLSRGMRIAAFFAALALAAAIYSLVEHLWGGLALPVQLGLLWLFPVAALAGVDVAARRDPSLYIASIFGATAYATFWLAAVVSARVLDVPFGVPLLWLGAVFGLALAIPYGFRVVLGAALAALILALAATPFAFGGSPWTTAFAKLEPMLTAAVGVLILSPGLSALSRDMGVVTRQVALSVALGIMLILSMEGTPSVLPLPVTWVEGVYQALTLVATMAAIGVGLRWRVGDIVNVAAVALTVLLVSRYVEWFWTVVPAYVFFSLLAAFAFAWLLALRRWRLRLGGGA